jgi:hypothetical protein
LHGLLASGVADNFPDLFPFSSPRRLEWSSCFGAGGRLGSIGYGPSVMQFWWRIGAAARPSPVSKG